MEEQSSSAAKPSDVDRLLAALVADQPPTGAALALANLSARVATELHRLARAESQARRGQPEWGRWAKLANAARASVLQVASCRDAARELAASDEPRAE